MLTILTACSLLILGGCVLCVWRALVHVDECAAYERTTSECVALLRAERDRVTVLERDTDALRRELRKLSGKFYARERELDAEEEDDDGDARAQHPLPLMTGAAVCENWLAAQSLGPASPEAGCPCSYCVARREHRRALRDSLVPKTVRGQAEVAKLNAGKP